MFTFLFCWWSIATVSEHQPNNYQSQLCGVYSVHAALRTLGLSVNADELLDSQFISDDGGSTGLDLCRAIQKFGGYSFVLGSANVTTLKSLDTQKLVAILNLRTRSDALCTGHWVLYLGETNGKACLYDYARGPVTIEMRYYDLLTRWEGGMIVVSTEKLPTLMTHLNLLFSGIFFRSIFLFFLGIAVFYLAKLPDPTIRVMSFLGLSWTAALAWQMADKNSPANNSASAFWISAPTGQVFKNTFEISYSELLKSPRDFILVDARPQLPRAKNGLKGTFNLGVDLHCDEFLHKVNRLNKDSRIVVFCHSRSCRWADLIASRLSLLGFKKICVFRPGETGYRDFIRQISTAIEPLYQENDAKPIK